MFQYIGTNGHVVDRKSHELRSRNNNNYGEVNEIPFPQNNKFLSYSTYLCFALIYSSCRCETFSEQKIKK